MLQVTRHIKSLVLFFIFFYHCLNNSSCNLFLFSVLTLKGGLLHNYKAFRRIIIPDSPGQYNGGSSYFLGVPNNFQKKNIQIIKKIKLQPSLAQPKFGWAYGPCRATHRTMAGPARIKAQPGPHDTQITGGKHDETSSVTVRL